jgi:anti-sigma factor RsiW
MSHNCEEIKPRLTDYALQEVGSAEGATIESHLASCAACRREMQEARAMLGLLQRSEMVEELPRSIRVAAQPAVGFAMDHQGRRHGWWAAMWNSAGRLAFAGGALACLAVGLMGIFQARLSYTADGFQIAFGSTPVAATAPQMVAAVPTVIPASTASQLSREEIESLIASAVQASALRQKNELSGLIQNVSLKADERRTTDLQQMSDMFRYMQATQTNLWKEQVQSQQIVAVLAQKNGVRLTE